MGDPWADVNEKINSRVIELKSNVDSMAEELRENVKQAKEDAVFQAIAKLSTKVDALAARLQDPEDT